MADELTAEQIKALRTDRITYYNELHKQQKIDDNYYELVFKAGVPKDMGYEQRTPSSARDWVDLGVRLYTLDNPKAKVPPRGNSDTARQKDIVLEALYDFWLREIILKIKEAAKKLLLRGEVILKVWPDDIYMGIDMTAMSDDEREGIKQKKLNHFPLNVEIVDPINVYASPAHNGLVPVDVIEEYMMTIAEAKDLCKRNSWEWNSKWDLNKKSTNRVKWTSYFSGNQRCFMLEDKTLLVPEMQPNILKFCPYVHVPAGFGNSSYEGKPEYLYRSILYAKRDMLTMESRVLSQVDAINARYAWQKLMITGEEEAVRQIYPDRKMKLSPNEILRQTEQVKVEILKGDSPPPGLFEQLAIVAMQAQPPPVLAGTRPRGVPSAQGIEDLISTGKPVYKDPIKNLEDALAVLMGMGARIIEEVYKDDVAIGDDKVIKPEDIAGHYDCQVKLLAEPPEATDIRKALGTNLQKAGVISHAYNLMNYHDMSKEETERVMAEILAEMALRQPALLDAAARDAMIRLGMKQQLEMIEEEEKRAAGNLPPRREPGTVPSGGASVRKRGRLTSGVEERGETAQEGITGQIGMGD